MVVLPYWGRLKNMCLVDSMATFGEWLHEDIAVSSRGLFDISW